MTSVSSRYTSNPTIALVALEINVLTESSGPPPLTVTYTRANTRAVYRKSVSEIHDMLTALESPVAAEDRARLSTLGPKETDLALVKERYKNIRANVLYARLDSRGRGRMQIAAELPLMYATGRRAEPPEVRFPVGEEEPRKPRKEQESLLEDTPFLRSVPVWRYAKP